MPRGLGFATATTSAAFFPHCEQRSRNASTSRVNHHPTKRSKFPARSCNADWSTRISGTSLLSIQQPARS
jgi:hypothetical protein